MAFGGSNFEMWDGEAEFIIQGYERIEEARAFLVDRCGAMPNEFWTQSQFSHAAMPWRAATPVATALFVIYDETIAFEFRMRWS